jgi:hypothetical protein
MRGVLFFLAWSSVAFAGTIEDTIPDARYHEYGQAFANYTCQISGTTSDGKRGYGTCVLIAPHWAVTAAHVTKGMAQCSVATFAGEHVVSRVIPHPAYAGEYGWNDIALVHTSQEFRLQRFPPLSDGTEQLGTVAAAAGYGMTGTLSTGISGDDAGLRAGTQILTATERTLLVCDIRRTGTPLPFCIAPGDSGGGLWAAGADGTTRLVGIHSCVSRRGTERPRYAAGEESCHTRVSLFTGWIREVVGQPGEPCMVAGCEP